MPKQIFNPLSGTFDSVLTNDEVIASTLTGYTAGAGTVASTDSVVGALQKIDGNDALKVPIASVGVANGVAPLDASSKIPSAYLPSTVLQYLGLWNPSTNTPTLSDLTGTNGYVYQVSAAFAVQLLVSAMLPWSTFKLATS